MGVDSESIGTTQNPVGFLPVQLSFLVDFIKLVADK